MALKVLLADHDEEWLATAKKFLEENFYEVVAVDNGKKAQLALYNEKFFIAILNYEIQNHSGAQVLTFIRKNHRGQRVLLVLDREEMLGEGASSQENLEKLGVSEVICRPFSMDQLLQTMEGHQSLGELMAVLPKRQGVSEEVEVNTNDGEFTKIKIDEFYSSKNVLFDLYVRLSSGRYVKILHAGDQFDKERIDKYKNEKQVQYLYFSNKDRRKYIQFLNHMSGKVVNNRAVTSQTKVSLLKNISEKFLEETFTVGLKPQIIEQGKEITANIYNMIEGQDDLYKVLKNYQDFDPSAFTHAYLVTLFSSCIIKQFEWQSRVTIETTAFACMFHDIGKMKLKKELLEKRPEELDAGDLEEYKKHPEYGVEMLHGFPTISNSVKQIIFQHHEYYDGSGFPLGIKRSKILTLANIVAVADDFVHIIMKDDLKPVDALRKLLSDKTMVPKYNSQIIENFIKVFTDPGKIQRLHELPSNSNVVNKKVS
ncbi:MAG: HD domain-containing protein [Halobacteriovoraceae bacterium]|nr:HD domain-containing protein [Halobacteriovoraceae bacterium]